MNQQTFDTENLRAIGKLLSHGYVVTDRSGIVSEAADIIDAQAEEIDRLLVIDREQV